MITLFTHSINRYGNEHVNLFRSARNHLHMKEEKRQLGSFAFYKVVLYLQEVLF